MKQQSAYSLPQIYDIAFDWRDIGGECDFLVREAERHLGRPVKSSLEMACGPGYHVREMARRGICSHGLDLSPEMVSYASARLREAGLEGEVFAGDMRKFEGSHKYDLIYILLVSFAHLLTNQDILDNLICASRLLNPRGVYIISTVHPRDFFGDKPISESSETSWTEERDGITVTTNWGGINQQYDPLTEIDEIMISYKVTQNGMTELIECPEKLRRLSLQTLRALVQLNGQFEIVNLLGDFDSNVPLSNAEESVRMLVVAQKRA